VQARQLGSTVANPPATFLSSFLVRFLKVSWFRESLGFLLIKGSPLILYLKSHVGRERDALHRVKMIQNHQDNAGMIFLLLGSSFFYK
jgi:hypothetical protein